MSRVKVQLSMKETAQIEIEKLTLLDNQLLIESCIQWASQNLIDQEDIHLYISDTLKEKLYFEALNERTLKDSNAKLSKSINKFILDI